jgi:hypothetical protein
MAGAALGVEKIAIKKRTPRRRSPLRILPSAPLALEELMLAGLPPRPRAWAAAPTNPAVLMLDCACRGKPIAAADQIQ